MKRFLFTFLFVFFCTAMALYAEDKTVKIVTEEWEDFTNADGTGIYFDIFREVFEKNGYTLDISIMKYIQAKKRIQSGESDVVLGVYEGEETGMIFPKYHFSADDVTVWYLKGRSYKNEKSLENKKVGWIRGYDYEKYININMNIQKLDTRESGVNMLLKKRLDYFIDNIYDVELAIENLGLDSKNFETKLIKFLNLYPCFANNDKGATLSKIWDREMSKLVKSGKIKELHKEYDVLYNYNF
ncbi:MAG TPA: transporter substrate-binding domain-containing protein [Spirochaetota bacterium]|nr:MAG: extracellular solute-binding protein [Spirochaetes bacterium ADurb.Bin133]HNZ26468.1 transporter substrate-binding domain-containing protein [Spirochaetota bacterium]HPY86983.1 transporter substrate-binding domain-containing protein [Spirochaetota bacterium]HQB61932.1 transporter substrate-binding domain-containing protein [Spirochaetota bacterium]